MKRWPTKPLGELILPTEQRDPRQNANEVFSYVDISGVDNKAKTIATTKTLAGVDAPSRARKVIRKGDVIVSTVRPNLNAVALVPISLDNQICSTGFSVLRPSEKLLSGYLFAFARSPSFVDHLVARTTGANYPAVNDSEVKDVPVPVPSLAEQERIVKLLEKVDELRELRVQADHRTTALIPALFNEMFGDLANSPKNWERRELKSICVIGDGNHSSNYPKASEMVPTGVPFIRAANLQAGRLDDADMRFISPEKHQKLRKGHLKSGDVLFSNRGEIGKLAIVPRDYDGSNLNSQLAWLRPKEMLLSEYLYCLLDSDFYQAQFKRSQQGAALQQFTIKQLSAVKIPLPPLSQQKVFGMHVAKIRELEADQASSRHRLDDFFQATLQSAFNGEL